MEMMFVKAVLVLASCQFFCATTSEYYGLDGDKFDGQPVLCQTERTSDGITEPRPK